MADQYFKIVINYFDLIEDEEWGDTHVALTVLVRQGGTTLGFYRWNNHGHWSDEGENETKPRRYLLSQSPPDDPNELGPFKLTTGAEISVHAWANDDDEALWPGGDAGDDVENDLGGEHWHLDSGNPQWGEYDLLTITDQGNQGIRLHFTVSPAPPPTPPLTLTIEAIEVTQAIQSITKAIGGKHQQPRLPLVAHRPTLVRAYLDSGVRNADGGLLPGVTGRLSVAGASTFNIDAVDPIVAGPFEDIDRSALDNTLNFIIPGKLCEGEMRLTVTARQPSGATVSSTVTANFERVSTQNIMVLRMRSGLNGPISEDGAASAIKQIQWAYPLSREPGEGLQLHFYPVPMDLEFDLSNDEGKGDFLGWLDDILDLEQYHLELNGVSGELKLYALLPFDYAGGASLQDDAVAYGSRNFTTVLHELGHLYGLNHAPCGTPAPPVASDYYPEDGSLGDMGVYVPNGDSDVIPLTIFQPQTNDFMGYCLNRSDPIFDGCWIGSFHWSRLYGAFRR